MEQDVLSKKAKGFKVTAGVVALAVAILWGYRVLSEMEHIRFVVVRDAIDHIGIFDLVDYLSVLNWLLIKPVVIVVAMILFALYVFVFYCKKQNLFLGLSVGILVTWGTLVLIMNVIVIMMDYILRMQFSLFSIIYIIETFSRFAITVSFIIILIKTFGKIKFDIKIIPIIAIVFSTVSMIAISLIENYFSVLIISFLLLDISHLVPFLVFMLFCPIIHKNYENNEAKDT